ncbi:hypothetical protein G6F26_008097 [Rhizopus arrhizus]|nr:hypothetical protein G6F30_006619 [Rhizopus arrhizus]KAG1021878.1 hypothetical protein G6F26_008097 [Rhizopus arrhizus]KAG1073996.1 hypothetical protein G6F41_002146 [Rhizopus arrhizus]KAG1102591.1 hypothetical protein G6F39_002496 [Rhizopus arrhizus]KAG1421571.1 hypothetical protein G6F59_006637 [Rhizopus arrhizus]
MSNNDMPSEYMHCFNIVEEIPKFDPMEVEGQCQRDLYENTALERHKWQPVYGLNCETIFITNRYPVIDHILKDGITFENDAVKLLSCRALDPAVPLVRIRLSNLPFLKEDILKEQLKMSLEPHGFVLDLGILQEFHTGVPKNDDRFSPLSHHLPWYQSEDEGFYAVWSDMPNYCRYCYAEGHAVPECPKNVHPVFVGTVARKTPTAPQDRVDLGGVQSSQASSGITMPITSSQPLTLNTMKRKRSIRNESGDDPRIHSSTLLTTEEDSILVSTQEVLKALFSETAEPRDDTPMEINAGNTDNTHVTTDIVIVDQATKNTPQSQHQAAMDSHRNGRIFFFQRDRLYMDNDPERAKYYFT